jgi:hypothetical protein
MGNILLVDLMGTEHLRELGRDGRIILELISDQFPSILSNWFRWSSSMGKGWRRVKLISLSLVSRLRVLEVSPPLRF